MNRNAFLIAGGSLSALAGLSHALMALAGAPAYRYFGAGESMALAAEAGSPLPAVVTLGICGVLVTFGAYAFSAAGVLKPLPKQKLMLSVITGIFLIRGGAVLLELVLPHFSSMRVPPQEYVFSLIALAIGMLYAMGGGGLQPEHGPSRSTNS